MLYLGKDQPPSWEYHQLHDTGYANRALYEFWAKRDPIPMQKLRLETRAELVRYALAQGLLSEPER